MATRKSQINPARLRPSELARLLAEWIPGAITSRQVQYQADTAEFPFARGGRINLIQYSAWLRRMLFEGRRLKEKDPRTAAQIMRDRRAAARDIGDIPAVKDPRRRRACARNLERFLLTYMASTFTKPFSADHCRVIAKTERAILEGGLYAEAVFRAFGKTSITIGACLWGALNALRRFIVEIGATQGDADSILESIVRELLENPLLLADFPESCYPFRALEGIRNRCAFQTCHGELTHIEWSTDRIVLPTIRGAPSSGAIIKSFGLTSALLGLQHKRADLSVVRPDFIILNDPQTAESALSPAQCEKREAIIQRDILGLSGHDIPMAGLMTFTCFRKGDMAHRYLDRERHPEWQADVLPMVKCWPKREDLWTEYAALRRQVLPDSAGGRREAERQADAFYAKRRRAMDAGAEISWKHRFEKGERSALQHAYNVLIDKGRIFFQAQYQNDPIDEYEGLDPPLEPRDLMVKTHDEPRGVVPAGLSTLVAFVDAGSRTHCHWCVCAWADGFTGAVIDYGRESLAPAGRGGVEAELYATIARFARELHGRQWAGAGSEVHRIERVLVDSGWKSGVVYRLAQANLADPEAWLVASKGQGGERELWTPPRLPRRYWGDGWYHAPTRRRDARLLVYDVDRWKSFAAERLRTPAGGAGALTLFAVRDPHEHQWFAEHLCAERSKLKKKSTGDVYEKWAPLPGRPNHGFDALVGCCVAGARCGVASVAAPVSSRGSTARRTLAQALGKSGQ